MKEVKRAEEVDGYEGEKELADILQVNIRIIV